MNGTKLNAEAEMEKLQHESFSYFLHETKSGQRAGDRRYSGSAGWMYRLIVESILGVRREADRLHFEPCIPAHWPSFKMNYRYRETVYQITVHQTRAADDVTLLTVDDIERPDMVIALIDDRQKHEVDLRIHVAQS